MNKERKVIIVDSCDSCPYIGKCKPWKKLDNKHRMILLLNTKVGQYILNGCPLPDGEDNAEATNLDIGK